MSQKIKTLLLSFILIAFGYIFFVSHTALAAGCPAGQSIPKNGSQCVSNKTAADCPHAGVDPKDPTKCKCDPNAPAENCLSDNPIIMDLNNIIKVFSGLVGILVIGMIIVGGIQYAIAGDNPTGVTAAKHRIINALIALAVYIFMLAFLQWLIPGGII